MILAARMTAYATLGAFCLWLWLDGHEVTVPVASMPSHILKALPSGSATTHLRDWQGSTEASPFNAQNEAFLESFSGAEEQGRNFPSPLAVPSPHWALDLADAITNADPSIRRSGLEQAILIHTAFLNAPNADGNGQPPFVEEIERQMLEAAWDESDPMLIEDEYLPFLAAQPSEASRPVLEHLLEKPLPGETMSAIVETLVDGTLWSRAQAWVWIQQASLSEDDLSDLLSGLQDAFPDGAFDNPPS